MEKNFLELLELRVQASPNKIVYNFLENGESISEKISYKELRERAINIARYLTKEGLCQERAILLYPSGIDFIVAFFACLYAGVIAVPAYPPRRNRLSRRIQGIIRNATPKIIITCSHTKITSEEFSEDSQGIPVLNTAALEKQEEDIQLPKISNEGIAFLQYTSGSTGVPKGVTVTHNNIINNVLDIKQLCNSTSDDVLVSWLPVFHDMGLVFGLLHPFYCDFPAYIMPPSVFIKKPITWLKAISKYQGTHSAAPNFAYDICLTLKEEQIADINLEKWRNVINGAEPIRSQTLKDWVIKFQSKGFREEFWMPSYGLAENTLYTTSLRMPHKPTIYELPQQLAASTSSSVKEKSHFVGCGTTGKGSKVVLFHLEENRKCKHGEVGEIWIKGKSVAQGYWQNPIATKDTFENYLPDGEGPFLRTGDLGFQEKNDLVVTGRMKDLIIIGGKNLFPQDLEVTAENSHEQLRSNASAAFSIMTEDGESLVLVLEIVRSAWRSVREQDIVTQVQKNLLDEHGITAYSIVLIKPFSINKTSSGKIQRSACKQAYLNRNLSVVYEWSINRKEDKKDIKKSYTSPNSHEVKVWLVATISDLLNLPTEKLRLDEPLSFYGLNSIKAINLSGQIEGFLNKDFSPTKFYDYPTIDALANHLSESADLKSTIKINHADSAIQQGDIAIIGMNCRFPGAPDINAFWDLLSNKKSGINDITHDKFYQRNLQYEMRKLPEKYEHLKLGGYLDSVNLFDPLFFNISPNEAYSMDPQHRLLLEVCWRALEDAGLPKEELKGQKIGVFIGISSNEYYQLQCAREAETSVYLGTGNSASIGANRISYFLDLKGPSLALDTACSSSLVAVHQACQSIRNGECHTAIVGGVNLILSAALGKAFSRAGMLSINGLSRPFDQQTNGYVRGEGCGVIILKSSIKAKEDKNQIHAYIKGSAINQDGRSNGLTAPSGLAQQEVILEALRNANLSPEAISYIETHGTGTPLGDPIEFNALNSVYGTGQRKEKCYLGAVKSNIGHLEAAAGMSGLIKTVLTLKNKVIPPILNLTSINQRILIDNSPFEIPVSSQSYDKHIRNAAVSSFGFGGTNAHVIIQNADDDFVLAENPVKKQPHFHLLTISARSVVALKEVANSYIDLLEKSSEEALGAICSSSSLYRTHLEYRLAYTGKRKQDILQKLYAFIEAKETKDLKKTSGSIQVLFLFGGQGTQYISMGKELYQTSSFFKSCMDECDRFFHQHLNYSILDVLVSDPAQFNQTIHIQPLVFAIEYSLAKLWIFWNVMPSAVMGHSLGEYVAACIAGVFSLEDACYLIAERARLMQNHTEAGKMLAITASIHEVKRYVENYQEVVSIAAINSKENVVVSGNSLAIEAIYEKLNKNGIKCQYLKVEQAFHSPLMRTIVEQFKETVSNIALNPPQIKFFSALTGEQATEFIATPDYWCRHILEPVNFYEVTKNVIKSNFKCCLELSPHPVLTSLLLANDVPFFQEIFPSLKRKQSDWEISIESLGRFYELGVALAWKNIYSSFSNSRIALPSYPFQKQEFWLEPETASNNELVTPPLVLDSSNGTTKVNDLDLIIKELQSLAGEMLGVSPRELPVDIPLLEIGADSIVLLRILKKIEQIFEVKITPRQIFEEYPDLKTIATFIKKRIPSSPSQSRTTHKQDVAQTITPLLDSNGSAFLDPAVDKNKPFNHSVEALMRFQLSTLKDTIDQQLAIIKQSGKGLNSQVKTSKEVQEEKPIIYDTRLLEEHKPLTAKQHYFLHQLIQRFTIKTSTSKAYAQKYRPVLSDWINTIDFRKILKEISYPILSKSSSGARIWDADGNEYIDLAIGYGVNFFGSKPDFIVEAIKQQLEEGFELAVQSDLAGEVASLICELTGAERVTFTNTGTEAIMAALRIARTVTGRKKIVIFNGFYHGTFDGNLAQKELDGEEINASPVTPGTPYNFVKDVIVMEPGSEKSIQLIKQHQREIAAILIEPVQSRRPGIFPVNFLRQLREVSTNLDITLIFDEIITGFRIHPGGAQALLGFNADITTYGKVVGGGMPIGIIAGKSRFLDAIDGGEWTFGDDSVPEARTTLFGGTFCKHPLALAAALAVLKKMKKEGPALQESVNELTQKLADEVNIYFDSLGIDIKIDHFGSLFRFQSKGKYNPLLRPVELDIFFRLLLDKGIYTWERRVCFLSTAHTPEDIALILTKVKEAVQEMIEGGFFTEAKFGNSRPLTIPLLEAQRQLLTLSDYSPEGSIAYNITTSLKLEGRLEFDKLNRAFKEVINRNEALRIVFDKAKGVQIILQQPDYNIQVIEYPEGLNTDIQATIQAFANKESQKPFDLGKGPLFRMSLLKLGEEKHALIFSGHHIIYDGWSASTVLSQLAELYSGYHDKTAISEEGHYQYSSYVYAEKQQIEETSFKRSKDFWINQFSACDSLFELPGDYPRPGVSSYAGKRIRRLLKRDEKNKLLEIGKNNGNSPFMTFLAAFTILLYKLSGKNLILIGIPVNGRKAESEHKMVGFAASILPLFLNLDKNLSFIEVLNLVKKEVINAFEHADCSLPYFINEIKKQNTAAPPGLVSVVFNMDSNAEVPAFKNLKTSLEYTPISYTTHDIGIDLINFQEALQIECDFSTELYQTETMDRLLDCYETIIYRIIQDVSAPICQLSVLSDTAKENLLFEFNPKEKKFRDLKPFPVLFNAFTRDQEKIAGVCGNRSITYGTLDKRSNQLAQLLVRLGLKKGDLVAIYRGRDLDALITIVSLLKCGGVYVPLDPDNNLNRTLIQLDDCQSRYLITDSKFIEEQAELFDAAKQVTHIICLDQPKSTQEISRKLIKKEVYFRKDINQQQDQKVGIKCNLSDPAYLLYTSGSTGKPKGALLTHEGVVNHILAEFSDLKIKQGFTFLQSANISSDIHVWQFLAPIIRGGKVVITSREELLSFEKIVTIIQKNEVSLIEWVPSYITRFLDFIEEQLPAGKSTPFPKLKWMILTGEEVSVEVVNRWLKHFPKVPVLNAYGPCEASDDVVQHKITGPLPIKQTKVPIGKPIANMNAFIVDDHLQLLPIGYVGEILISGKGVGLGYHNQIEKTKESFLPNPFKGTLGEKIYRTGDLGKWMPDGTLIFVGRKDQQVQIRGMRVELGEIEAVLRKNPAVKEAVILYQPGLNNDSFLHAYLVLINPEEATEAHLEAIKIYLHDHLPIHMVPTAFSVIAEFPLNINGKIDRSKLPDTEVWLTSKSSAYQAPRNPQELELCDIWQKLLKLPQIGINDNFFELGGHSLLATRVVSEVRKSMSREISVADIFSRPTIALLANFLSKKGGKDQLLPKLQPQKRGPKIPLSFAQERLWFLDKLEGSVHYHMPAVLEFKGDLDRNILELAFTDIVNRHEVLRTTIREENGEGFQEIRAEQKWPLAYSEISNELAIEELVMLETKKPFSLSSDFLLRGHLIKKSDTTHLLIFVLHHIISDGWSESILIHELIELYQAKKENRQPLLKDIKVQYADFSIWQRAYLQGALLEDKLKYWQNQLAEVEPLNLPTDFLRPIRQSTKGNTINFAISSRLKNQLNLLAKKENVTLFMLLLGVFKVMLYQYSRQEDICVGSPIANRTHQDLEQLIGFFVNTLVLRSQLNHHLSFKALVHQIKVTTLEAYKHQDVPFEKIVERIVHSRDTSRNPLFQVMFTLQNNPEIPALKIGDLDFSIEPVVQNTSQFDLSFDITELDEGLDIEVEYCTDLFTKATIEQMLWHFETLVQSVIKNPNQEIGKLSMLSEGEKALLLGLTPTSEGIWFNEGEKDLINRDPINIRFEKIAATHKSDIAITHQGKSWSYETLNAFSNQIANGLEEIGVHPGQMVGVNLDRSFELIGSLLGILKLGAVYVPLDTQNPAERVEKMISGSQLKVIITTNAYLENLNQTNFDGVLLMEMCSPVNKEYYESIGIKVKDLEQLSSLSKENVLNTNKMESWAYMLYTSGSTGEPKGAITRHNGAINHILAEYQALHLADGFRFLQSAGIGSDISVWQFLGPLLKGGRVVIIDQMNLLDFDEVLRILDQEQINIVEFVPSYAWGLIEHLKTLGKHHSLDHLQWVMLTGEDAPVKLVNEWKGYYPKIRILNCYGPCEASDDVVQYEVKQILPSNQIRVPIGSPIANMKVLILDKNTDLCPIGIVGEICIAGVGVGAGYWNMPKKTAASFVKNPFSEITGDTLYKTGDLGKWLPTGELDFLGRMDRQVKIRGHRIEMGEIESFIRDQVGINNVHVLIPEKEKDWLIAFIVLEEDQKAKASHLELALKASIQVHLPMYMRPTHYCFVDKIPVNLSNKVDTKKLLLLFSEQEQKVPQSQAFIPCETSTEKAVLAIWEKVLNKSEISADADFFEIGGHSLLVMRVSSTIKKQLSVDLDIIDLFTNKSIQALAAHIDRKDPPVYSLVPALIKQPRQTKTPLSFAQERLWFIDKLEGSTQYHMSVVFELNGDLDVGALEYAFNEIINRHEILRTVYKEIDGIAYQETLEKNTWKLAQQSFLVKEQEGHVTSEEEVINSTIRNVFDLAEDHMIRALLLKTSETQFKLILVVHHIAFDGWSEHIIVNELIECYAAKKENRPAELIDLKLQYIDYALWQRKYLTGEVLNDKLRYWENKLVDLEPLNLPLDFPRPAILGMQGGHLAFKVDKETCTRLELLAKNEEVTLFMLLLTSFKVLLHKYTGQSSICVGSPIANRTQEEVEPLIGFFVNTLALRTDINGNPPFRELLQEVKVTTLEAYQHQDTPFEKIVDRIGGERDRSRSPLFQVVFVLQNVPETPEITLGDLRFTPVEEITDTSKFDLTFDLNQTDSGINISIEYNRELFRPDTINRMKEHYKLLLSSIIADPSQPLSKLKMLHPKEEEQLVLNLNNTAEVYPHDKTVIELFESQVAKTPTHTALVFESNELTYKELNIQVNRLAYYLKSSYQIKEGDLVAIILDRSEWSILSILAVLKTGAAYVPIEINQPIERQLLIIHDIPIKAVIVESIDSLNLGDIDADPSYSIIPKDFLVEASQWKDSDLGTENKKNLNDANSLAYVMYTSGSTGNPKGVFIKHQSIARLIFNSSLNFLNEDSVIYQYAPLAFDASTFEVWGALLKGGKLVVTGRALRTLEGISSVVKDKKVNTLWLTAGLFHLAVDECMDLFTGIKYILSGGDSIRANSIFKLLTHHKDIVFINGYGPTESTTFATTNRIHSVDEISFDANIIGKPIGNTKVYILESGSTSLVPLGCYGELCLAGPGIALGYHGQAELTQQKFINNPYENGDYSKIYRTGDWARWQPDGTIEFIGRRDHQVKIRGYRIELDGIEHALHESPLIKQSAVIVEEQGNVKKLVAFVVPNGPFDREKILTELKKKLPDYMIPHWIVSLERLPLTINGKVNKKALPKFDLSSLVENEFIAPQTDTEEKIAEIWKDLLAIEEVGIDDNFFELGGDSIITIQIVSRIRQLGYTLKPRDLFQHQTVRSLSAVIKKNLGRQNAEQGVLAGQADLLPIQHWFFEQDYTEKSHFNQAVLLDINKASKEVDLQKIVQALSTHHDALRFRYHQKQGIWIQNYQAGTHHLEIVSLEGFDREELAARISGTCEKYQKSLNLEKGEIFRWVLMRTPDFEVYNRLFLVAHHLVIDGVSWRILLSQFEEALSDLSKAKPIALGAKSSSYREWTTFLSAHAESPQIVAQLPFWQSVMKDAHPLPIDKMENRDARSTKKDLQHHSLSLGSEITRALLHDVNRSYNTKIDDILLSALAQTISNWTKREKVVFGLEGHGREDLSNEIDTTNTVGWFTNLYPVSLAVKKHSPPGMLIKSVKEQLRAIPDKGIGYGLLRYLHPSDSIRKDLSEGSWEIVFNYLGQMDNVINPSLWLKEAKESMAESEGELYPFTTNLEINSSISNGTLTFIWTFSQKQYEKETIEHLAALYLENLQLLIHHCLEKQTREFTPDDYGLNGKVSNEELEAFLTENEKEGDEILKF